jgi:hypothetical protein
MTLLAGETLVYLRRKPTWTAASTLFRTADGRGSFEQQMLTFNLHAAGE